MLTSLDVYTYCVKLVELCSLYLMYIHTVKQPLVSLDSHMTSFCVMLLVTSTQYPLCDSL